MPEPARMKIALNLESFQLLSQRETLNPAKVVDFARELGLDGVELSRRMVAPEHESELLDALDRTGLEVISCYVFSDLLTPDAATRQEKIKAIQSDLKTVARLRSSRSILIPGALPDGVDADLARGWFIEALKQCLPAARDLGLQLTTENVGFQADVYARARDLHSICESVGPEMKLTFDAGNFPLVEEDVFEALDLLTPHIANVHVKDWHTIDPSAPPVEVEFTGTNGVRYCGAVLGRGVIELPGILRRLKQLDYSGYLSIEYEGVEDPFDSMRLGLAHLRSLLNTPAESS